MEYLLGDVRELIITSASNKHHYRFEMNRFRMITLDTADAVAAALELQMNISYERGLYYPACSKGRVQVSRDVSIESIEAAIAERLDEPERIWLTFKTHDSRSVMLYAERTWMVNDRMAALTKDKRVKARKKEKRKRYKERRKAKDVT